MKKLNQFVYIVDELRIYSHGKYRVSKNLPVGEYYIWGEGVEYSYTRETYDYSYRNAFEGYAVFEKGDRVTLESGMMTPVENIVYAQREKSDKLYPNHVYRVGTEIPTGFYLFKYDENYFEEEETFLGRYECGIDLYKANSDSRRTRERGEFGCVEITNEKRHIVVLNGVAQYYGESKFDEIKIIEDKSVPYNEFSNVGLGLFSNEILDLKLFTKHHKGSRFCGKVTMNVFCYEWYAINKKCIWRAKVKPFSGRGFQSAEIIFSTEDGLKYRKRFEGFGEIRHLYNDEEYKNCYLLNARLPDDFFGKELHIKLKSFNDIEVNEELEDYKDIANYLETSEIRKYYEREFVQLERLLMQIGGLNIERELKCFEEMPNIIMLILPVLEDIANAKQNLLNNNYKDTAVTFTVNAEYNKSFYCVAKLADQAKEVYSQKNGTEFVIVYNACQLEQIKLTYYILYYSTLLESDEAIKAFLQENCCEYYIINKANQCIAYLNNEYGYSSLYRDSTLGRIIKKENKKMKMQIDKIYSDIVKENRVPTRWGNEYRLFSLISSHNFNAQYQYHCEWLGQQSLDIYIESDQIGIEYQGEQHYKAIDIWGGEEGLKENQERDLRKQKICIENGVRLLEWSYKVPVNDENVVKFMKEHNIPFAESDMDSVFRDEMAPMIKVNKNIHLTEKKHKEKTIKYYIVQYDMAGNYINKYCDIGNAAESVNVSSTSISKVIRGLRNSAAGYVWKKVDAGCEIPQKIVLEFDVSKTNSGMAKRIAVLDDSGQVKQEYASIAEAARETGISQHHIQGELSKENSKEWKYM